MHYTCIITYYSIIHSINGLLLVLINWYNSGPLTVFGFVYFGLPEELIDILIYHSVIEIALFLRHGNRLIMIFNIRILFFHSLLGIPRIVSGLYPS